MEGKQQIGLGGRDEGSQLEVKNMGKPKLQLVPAKPHWST